jgi:hypothetical protein
MEKYIDKILQKASIDIIYNMESRYNFNTFGQQAEQEFQNYQNAIFFLIEHKLLNNNGNFNFNITPLGKKVFNNEGWREFIKQKKLKSKRIIEKEEIEFEKSRIDLELAKKMLKEYPKTKLISRFGFFIALVLALKELYIWLMQLLSQ